MKQPINQANMMKRKRTHANNNNNKIENEIM